MRTAIVLAAGESRRMGALKPLLPFGSGSVIGQVVRSLQASPIDAVLVVVGHRGAEIAAHLDKTPDPPTSWVPGRQTPDGGEGGTQASLVGAGKGVLANRPSLDAFPGVWRLASGVSIVPNPRYPEGMLTSVQAGVAAADPATTLFLIALADQPSIPPELIRHLIEVFEERRPGMLVPTFDGRRGHPLLIDARYREEIATLSPEVGLRELLQRYPDDLLLHPVSMEAVIRDLDTREEYEAELARWHRSDKGNH